ncbi:molybdopterin molybdotransferase MoeA [Roseicella frigidaeris]|nr:molybdopterin molybdotransferase MoeA [Roseicella frigidaeris]
MPAEGGAGRPLAPRRLAPAPAARLSVAAARERVLALAAPVPGHETLPLMAAAGRVLAEDLPAARDMPPFDTAAMDGFAIGPEALDREPPLPLRRRAAIPPGHPDARPLAAGEAARVLTGAAVPPGTAAVIFEEGCRLEGEQVVLLRRVSAGQHIRPRGEDAAAGTVVLRAGRRLGAARLGLAAAAGAGPVVVRRQARIGILSTGSELLPPGAIGPDGRIPAGTIPDANRPMLRAILADPCVALRDLGIARDDDAAVAACLAAARDLDLVVSTGSAAGSEADRLGPAIRALGGDVAHLALAQRPGKPLLLARLGALPLLGLAGNPVAALVGALLYARPLVERIAGLAPSALLGQPARLAQPREAGERTEFLPARLAGEAAGLPLLEVPRRFGSARLTPFAEADGLAEIRPDGAVRFHAFEMLAGG